MKVFLLFPDRDFDPAQKLPPHTDELVQDLELETLCDAMAAGDQFLFDIAKQVLLSPLTDPDVIRYRQEILRDCLSHPEVVRAIYQIPIRAREMRHRQWLGIFGTSPSSVLIGARNMLKTQVGLLKELRQIADQYAPAFTSRGFQRFFRMIQEELDDAYFTVVEEHLKALEFRDGVLLRAELGKGNEGTNYILCKPHANGPNWLQRVLGKGSPAYSFTLHPRDEHGARALGELRNRGLRGVAGTLAQSADHIESFLQVLRQELGFYIAGLNLYERLTALGEPIAFPEPAEPNERRLSFAGLYDVCLALTMGQPVIGNTVHADDKDLVFITGANKGGKSTFLRSIGQAQLMMQCGMFVPAESFTANVCSGIFTHFKREEDATMQSGKFDEELRRMSAIIGVIRPNALLLCNESFASTNEREGSEIARQIISALLEHRVKIFYVTHMYELARGFFEAGMPNTLFLRADRRPDGSRTFQLYEGEPLPTSFGVDIYRQVFQAVPLTRLPAEPVEMLSVTKARPAA